MSTIALTQNNSATTLSKTVGERAQSSAFQHARTSTSGRRNGPRFTKKMKNAVISAVTLGGVVFGGWHVWNSQRAWVTTENAFVQGHVHQVSTRVSGTVAEVLVDENDVVTEGQPLARLDPRDWEVKRDQARAAITQADAQIQQANAQIAEAESNRKRIAAEVEQARAQAGREEAGRTKADADFARAKNLFIDRRGVISRAEFDTAKAAQETAAANLKAARSAIESAEAQVAAVESSVTAAQAARDLAGAQKTSAEASLREAELQLSYTTIKAPKAGRIGRKNVEVGNRVQPGQALLAIVQNDIWVVANFKETQLENLATGLPVTFEIDAFPDHKFHGTVESFAPASGAQFALLPPDNATGNFTKVVQRVPVKLVFDAKTLGPYADRIVPGMSVHAKVKVGS